VIKLFLLSSHSCLCGRIGASEVVVSWRSTQGCHGLLVQSNHVCIGAPSSRSTRFMIRKAGRGGSLDRARHLDANHFNKVQAFNSVPLYNSTCYSEFQPEDRAGFCAGAIHGRPRNGHQKSPHRVKSGEAVSFFFDEDEGL